MFEDVKILKAFEEVEAFIPNIQRGADSERDALGFLPPSAYEQSASQGKLFVAVGKEGRYLGHIMFGGVFPHRKVMQTYCIPDARKTGVADKLIGELIGQSIEEQYLSLSAKVASDLEAANQFYSKHGFQTVGILRGGKTTGRVINKRVCELGTPNLIDLMQPVGGDDSLAITLEHILDQPIYAIDLNVLFDVGKKRIRHQEAAAVFRAAFSRNIHAVVTQEFVEELQRNSNSNSIDPFLQLALSMDVLPPPDKVYFEEVFDDIASNIFPEKYKEDRLSLQDRSDIRHLTIAISNKITGFITNEKALLRARVFLDENYGLDVIGTSDFSEAQYSQSPEISFAFTNVDGVELKHETEEIPFLDIADFLERMLVPKSDIQKFGSSTHGWKGFETLSLKEDTDIVLCAFWSVTQSPRRSAEVYMFVDEHRTTSVTATDYALAQICSEVTKGAFCNIELHVMPGHFGTWKKALSHGFRHGHGANADKFKLTKLSLHAVINKNSWAECRTTIRQMSGVVLPEKIPTYTNHDQTIHLKLADKNELALPLFDLERLLSPVAFLLPGRRATVVPIKKSFADDLLGTSKQLGLFGQRQASLLKDRVYYNTPNARAIMTVGTLVVFYESGHGDGRSCITAMARITNSRLLTVDQVGAGTKEYGVLDDRELKSIGKRNTKLVSKFDNIFVFEKPVTLERLREIGCVDGANFITAKQISHEHTRKIIEEGFPNG